MARRGRYARVKRSARRAGGFLSGGTSKKIMAGLGSAYAGNIIGSSLGVNRMIPAAALGYFTAGGIGLITAIAAEAFTGNIGSLLGGFGVSLGSQNAQGTVYN